MARSRKSGTTPVLVCGEDEFSVKRRAKELYQEWSKEVGGFDHEVIDAQAANSGEALKALARLREALQTLPFFGAGKVVWFQNCSFLGDERAASALSVGESLASLADELKDFDWKEVRLLVTAGKVDKRKSFYKTLAKIGSIESFESWSVDDRDWETQAESWAACEIKELQKTISDEALAQFVAYVGPNARQLSSEALKLALFAGQRTAIVLNDVEAIVTRHKQARAFALGDALGDRDLPRVLRTLDEELWELNSNSQKSEIGLLYGLISKVRVMILLKEMLRAGWIKPNSDYAGFKTQLARVPASALPGDKRFNPLAMNPFLLYKALPHAKRYAIEELVRAMEVLLECNRKLVLSGLDGPLVLQQTLVDIVRPTRTERYCS